MNLMLALVLALQTTLDPLLSRLVGQWSGTGTVLNQPSKIEMSWSAELGGQFVRLTSGTNAEVAFEWHAYYRSLGDAVIAVMWFETRMFRPLEARRDGDALYRSGHARTERRNQLPASPTARWKSSIA